MRKSRFLYRQDCVGWVYKSSELRLRLSRHYRRERRDDLFEDLIVRRAMSTADPVGATRRKNEIAPMIVFGRGAPEFEPCVVPERPLEQPPLALC